MFKKSIKKGVMHIIKSRVKEAQKSYDQKEKAIEAEHLDTVKTSKANSEVKKLQAFKSSVQEFLGTILS